jgi:hypothetical protein
MRHNTPDVIGGYLVAIGAYYAGRAGRITDALGDEDDPVMVPVTVGRAPPYRRRGRRCQRRQRITPTGEIINLT